jgi:hypothetical protein
MNANYKSSGGTVPIVKNLWGIGDCHMKVSVNDNYSTVVEIRDRLLLVCGGIEDCQLPGTSGGIVGCHCHIDLVEVGLLPFCKGLDDFQ